VTGGDRGLSLPKLDVFGMGETGFYYVVALLTALLLIAAKNLFRTRIGRAFIAVRERDYAAEVLGIDVVQTKLLAFGLGAAYAGVAGALGAAFLRIVTPDQFTLIVSVFFLAAVVVGGRASILGSILGAVFMTLMPEILQFVLRVVSGGANLAVVIVPLREIIFGGLIVGFLLFEPRGLVGLIERAFGNAETFDSKPEA
jgi:branched-chain amino acid transport system permease protein